MHNMAVNDKIEKKNFGYLGEDYQFRLAKCFMELSGFFGEIVSLVEPAYFTNVHLRTFVGVLKDYYLKESCIPSYDIMKIQLKSKARTTIENLEIDALIEKLKSKTSLEGNTTVKDLAIKFFKQQNYVKIARRIIDSVEKGDDNFEEIQNMWETAIYAGNEDEYGFSIFDIEDKALSPRTKVPIPTGVSKLDEVLNGGLEKKKIGVIIGSSGFGKSTFSTAIASYASTYKCDLNNNEGYKVLQIYFEDDNIDITRKHFARIVTEELHNDVEAKDLTNSQKDIDEIKEVLRKYPNREMIRKNLRLKSFLTNTKSASDIEIFIRKLINTGFKPDLVIVDYFECLLPEKGGHSSDSEWKKQGETMRKLENMAKELDVAIWVPTQGNKGSFTSELVTMDQAGGSVIKVQAAHVIISIARTTQDQANNLATIAVLKNRSGRAGDTWQRIKFNNGTCMISCDETLDYSNTLDWLENEQKAKEEERLARIKFLQRKQQEKNEEESKNI